MALNVPQQHILVNEICKGFALCKIGEVYTFYPIKYSDEDPKQGGWYIFTSKIMQGSEGKPFYVVEKEDNEELNWELEDSNFPLIMSGGNILYAGVLDEDF